MALRQKALTMLKSLLAFGLVMLAVPAAAQQGTPVQVPNFPIAGDEGGLTGSVTDDSAWQDLGIAIPSFATNRDVPTPANAQGTAALALELSRVVYGFGEFDHSQFREILREYGIYSPHA